MTFPIIPASTVSGSYQISRSLRFRSSASAYLSRTPASAGNRQKWTWSGWVKLGVLGTNRTLFSCGTSYSQYGWMAIAFGDNSGTGTQIQLAEGANGALRRTNAVFRDPSAFYHVVVSFDSTQATAANRANIYVNGVVQTYDTNLTITQNTDYGINQALAHNICTNTLGAGTGYFDGYLAEVNFIDGQALTPSSFGAFDTNGVWQPARYTGSYGTNGFYLPFSSNTSAETLAYDFSNTNSELISNSMFVSNVTGWTATGSGSPSVTWQSNHTMRLANSANNAPWAYTTISTVIGQTYYAQAYISAASIGGSTRSIILKKADDANYSINSVDVASTTQGSAPIGLAGTFTATATTTYIIIFADVIGAGTTGIDISQVSVALGGYKKSWNPFNISTTTGTTYDSMIDSPTNYADGGNGRGNYAVLNPLDKDTSRGTLSDGNLKWVYPTYSTQNTAAIRGTIGVTSGKWYFESTNITYAGIGNTTSSVFTTSTQNPTGVGINYGTALSNYIGAALSVSGNYVYFASSGYSASLANGTSLFASCASGDVLNIAIDFDNGKIWVGKNGTWYNSGNPATGTSPTSTFTAPSGLNLPWLETTVNSANTNTASLCVNFGQQPFNSTPPSGFSALNTQNLPTPTIAAGNRHFDVVTRGGTGGVYTKTGLGFQPDFAWTKLRNTAYNHYLQDAVRGVAKQLSSDTTAAEQSIANAYTAFNADGYTLGSSTAVNDALYTYVDWLWKGGNGTSNIAVNAYGSTPSIASTVSANVSAGFSVVTYTGNGTAGATVGHGLGAIPSMIIVRNRVTAGSNWPVYHSSLNETKVIYLNLTNASSTTSTFWNNTAPTSAVFSVGTNTDVNESTKNLVAYCFAPVSSFSAFGSFVGNGSSDGPMVFTNFRPRWIMFKPNVAGENWTIVDTSRDTYNVNSYELYANLSNAEGSANRLDILSNGFKMRAGGALNSSGNTILYAAFAEVPFKTSRAR